MKVIIQDTKTKRYFSDNGRWVVAEEDAKDFVSLMRAYHFAKQFAVGRFEVLLFSPDDDYRTSIIEGEGYGVDAINETVSFAAVKNVNGKKAKSKKDGGPSVWEYFNACMISTRNFLN